MYVPFVVFTDCESCSRPTSTNPGSMEAGKHGLTRRASFLACRLELDAVPIFNEFVCLPVSVCVSVSECVTFVAFEDCESCMRPISTNPGSMEAGEYGLTRGTCFIACRLQLDAVAGLLWISWCVFVGGRFFRVFFFNRFCFFLRTHTACR